MNMLDFEDTRYLIFFQWLLESSSPVFLRYVQNNYLDDWR